MSETIGSIVGVLKIEDQASNVIGTFNAAANSLFGTLQSLGGGFQDFGSIAQSAFSGFAMGGPVGAALGGATAAIGEAVKGIQDAVTAAATLQTSWTDLQSVMHLTGAAWDDMKTKIDAYVESLRTTTTFSDTALINSFQQLITYGMSASQAMDAMSAATNLAAAKHIDLETAATALGKAFQGNDMLLVRYGVDVTTIAKQVASGTEAIKEMGAQLATAGTTQLAAFSAAMTAAGLSLTDANGKLLAHAAVLKEITDAWKAGSISGDQLSAIVGALGITFDGSKVAAMDYANVLTEVNTQYGGAAQAQSSTYAGLQERMNNAWQVLSEKVGTAVLPALSGFTEFLTSATDRLTTFVGGLEDWITALGKLPGVQNAVSGFQGIWDGLSKSFDDAWNSVKGDLLPAFQELQDAFKQLSDALQPVWDAFNELWHAITGSGGDFNIFKVLLEGLVLVIKGLAEGIRLIVPIVQMFAKAFKDAADFISPALTWIHDTVWAFINWITKAFQGFYDWLVGHSLWQDMWDLVLKIATSAITSIMGKVGSEFLTGLQTAFSAAVAAVQSTWNAGLEGVKTALGDTILAVQTKNPELATALQAGLDALNGNWQGAFTRMGTVAKDEFGTIKSSLDTFLSGMQSALNSAWSQMQSGAVSAMNNLQSYVTSTMQNIINAANNLWNQLTHHSIWPDMLAEMVDQTQKGMAAIQGEFEQGLTSPSGVIGTFQTAQTGLASTSPLQAASASLVGASQSQTINIPITVNIDGQQVAAFLEKRIVDTLIRDATRSKRY
jgi:hypothetical protein